MAYETTGPVPCATVDPVSSCQEAAVIELRGAAWEEYRRGAVLCITVNGCVKRDGPAVIGRGIAAQAARRYPEPPLMLGREIRHGGWARVILPRPGRGAGEPTWTQVRPLCECCGDWLAVITY